MRASTSTGRHGLALPKTPEARRRSKGGSTSGQIVSAAKRLSLTCARLGPSKGDCARQGGGRPVRPQSQGDSDAGAAASGGLSSCASRRIRPFRPYSRAGGSRATNSVSTLTAIRGLRTPTGRLTRRLTDCRVGLGRPCATTTAVCGAGESVTGRGSRIGQVKVDGGFAAAVGASTGATGEAPSRRLEICNSRPAATRLTGRRNGQASRSDKQEGLGLRSTRAGEAIADFTAKLSKSTDVGGTKAALAAHILDLAGQLQK